WARISAIPEVVSSLMVMPSSFSTMLNQASRCAFWKAPPQDETVMLCCATLLPGQAIAMAAKALAPATMVRTINFIGLPPPRDGRDIGPQKAKFTIGSAQVKNIAVSPLGWPRKQANCKNFARIKRNCAAPRIDLSGWLRASSQCAIAQEGGVPWPCILR